MSALTKLVELVDGSLELNSWDRPADVEHSVYQADLCICSKVVPVECSLE